MAVPASRYRESPNAFPQELPLPAYLPDDRLRTVGVDGWIYIDGRQFRLGDGLVGQPVALRRTLVPDVYEVHFCRKLIAELDLREQKPRVIYPAKTVTHVSERV